MVVGFCPEGSAPPSTWFLLSNQLALGLTFAPWDIGVFLVWLTWKVLFITALEQIPPPVRCGFIREGFPVLLVFGDATGGPTAP